MQQTQMRRPPAAAAVECADVECAAAAAAAPGVGPTSLRLRLRQTQQTRSLPFLLLCVLVLVMSSSCVCALSFTYSQLSGACVTLAIAEVRPVGGPREVFAACQQMGVLVMVPDVSVLQLYTINQCSIVSLPVAMEVSGDMLFVTCGSLGVVAFNTTSRVSRTVVSPGEVAFLPSDLRYDAVSQRLFVVCTLGLISVETQGGVRVPATTPVVHVNSTQCAGSLKTALYARDVYVTCDGGAAGMWSVWRTNIDTGVTSGVIPGTACLRPVDLHVNSRGLFVLCSQSDRTVLVQQYSYAGVLLLTVPAFPGATPASLWASDTDAIIMVGSVGGGVLQSINGSTPVSIMPAFYCTSAVDLKVQQWVGPAGQPDFEMQLACTNAPMLFNPAVGYHQLLHDSCGTTDLMVISPISGWTYVGCNDRILVYDSNGDPQQSVYFPGVVSLSADLSSDWVYAACQIGLSRFVRLSATLPGAALNNHCTLPRALAGSGQTLYIVCTDVASDVLSVNINSGLRMAVPFAGSCPSQRVTKLAVGVDQVLWILCDGQVHSYDPVTMTSRLRANSTQCVEPRNMDASNSDGSVLVACAGSDSVPVQGGGVLHIAGDSLRFFTQPSECMSATSVSFSHLTGEIMAYCIASDGASFDYRLLVLSPIYGHYVHISDPSIKYGAVAYNPFNGVTLFTTWNVVIVAGCLFSVEISDQLGNVLSVPPLLMQPFKYEITDYFPSIPDALNSPTGMRVTVHFASACSATAGINGESVVTLTSGQPSQVIPVPLTSNGAMTLQIATSDAQYNYHYELGSVNRFMVQTVAGTMLLPTVVQPFRRSDRSYSMIAPIAEPFPASLMLTVDLAYGTAVASMDQMAVLNVYDDIPLTLDLSAAPAVPTDVHPLVLNASVGGLYYLTLSNACGFAIGVVGGSGTACAAVPQSACIPTDIHSVVCSPSFLAASLDVTSGLESVARTIDPRSPPGNRSVLLTTADTAGLIVSLGMGLGSSLIVPPTAGPALAPFSSLTVTFASSVVNTPPRECILPGLTGAAPDGSFNFTCQLPGEVVGAGFRFSLQVCAGSPPQCSRAFTSTDSLSSPMPSFVPMTLTRTAPVRGLISATGELIAAGMTETLRFQVQNIAPSAQITSVFYASLDRLHEVVQQFRLGGDNPAQADWITLESIAAMRAQNRSLPECRINSALSQPNLLVCDTPDPDPNNQLTGQSLHFLLIVGGQWVISADTYSYPVQPQVTRVSGCADSGSSTGDCPTLGNVTLTIFGSGFSTVERNAFAQIGGVDCPVRGVNLGGTFLTCTLPVGAGNNVPVVVQSYSLFSPLAPLLSYAAPRILNASCDACASWSNTGGGVQLTDCQRNTTGATLTLKGTHFGPGGATIFIGSVLCPSDGIVHADPHTSASCILPPGKGLGQPILLSQANGKLSTSVAAVSYSVCPAGTVDASVSSSVLDCIPCAPGEFSDTAGAQFCNACPGGLYLAAPPIDPLTGLQRYPRSDDCTACATGAQCTGQIVASAADHYLFTDAATKELRVALCPAGYCRQCSGDDVEAAALTGETVLTCCGRHRDPASPLCGRCLPGYEDWNGDCRPCSQSDGGLVFAFLLLSTLLVAWLAHSASNASVGLTAIALYFLQICTLQLQETAVLLSWLQAINFNPAVFRSSGDACPMKLSAYGQTVFAILVPVLLLAELMVVAAVHALAYARIPHSARGSLSAGAADSDSAAAAAASLRQLRRGSTFRYLTSRSRHHVAHWASRFSLMYYKNAAVAVLQFSYTSVSLAVIEFLWCVEVGPSRVVFSSPSMVCGSSEYKAVQPLAIAALVLFVIVFPLLVLAGGWWRSRRVAVSRAVQSHATGAGTASPRQSDAVSPVSHSLNVLIPLYGVFRPEAWYWSSLVLMRRTLFAFLSVSLASVPRTRNASFAFSNLVFCFLSLYAAPFRTRTLNLLDCGSQLALNVVALMTTVQLPPYGAAINILLFLVFLSTLLMFVAGVYMARRDRQGVLDAAMQKQIEAEQRLDHDGLGGEGRGEFRSNGSNGHDRADDGLSTEMITISPLHSGGLDGMQQMGSESAAAASSPSHPIAEDPRLAAHADDEIVGSDSAAL